ncbi:hypothetical protein D3C86_1437110 [compost metagenome]
MFGLRTEEGSAIFFITSTRPERVSVESSAVITTLETVVGRSSIVPENDESENTKVGVRV